MVVDNNIGLLNLSEVADMLHVHRNTLRHWANIGLIKSYRLGKRGDRRFAREDVIRFLENMN